MGGTLSIEQDTTQDINTPEEVNIDYVTSSTPSSQNNSQVVLLQGPEGPRGEDAVVDYTILANNVISNPELYNVVRDSLLNDQDFNNKITQYMSNNASLFKGDKGEIEFKKMSVTEQATIINRIIQQHRNDFINAFVNSQSLREAILNTIRTRPEFRGPVGPQGPKGDVGPRGPIGPQGERGIQGPIGVVDNQQLARELINNPQLFTVIRNGLTADANFRNIVTQHLQNNAVLFRGPAGITEFKALTNDEKAAVVNMIVQQNRADFINAFTQNQNLRTAIITALSQIPQVRGPKGDTGSQGPQGPAGEGSFGSWIGQRFSTASSTFHRDPYQVYGRQNPIETAVINTSKLNDLCRIDGRSIWSVASNYNAVYTTKIFVNRPFVVNNITLSGSSAFSLFINGQVIKLGNEPGNTVYSYTFNPNTWYTIELFHSVTSENADGFISLGWNPKNYANNISNIVAVSRNNVNLPSNTQPATVDTGNIINSLRTDQRFTVDGSKIVDRSISINKLNPAQQIPVTMLPPMSMQQISGVLTEDKIADGSIPIRKLNPREKIPASRVGGGYVSKEGISINHEGHPWEGVNGHGNALNIYNDSTKNWTHFNWGGKNYIRSETDVDGPINFNSTVNLPISKTQGNLPISRIEGNITSERLGMNAVTNSHIANNTINGDKLLNNSIPDNKIIGLNASKLSGTINNSIIENNSITAEKIRNNAIDDTKISGVSASKLIGSIDDTKFGDNSLSGNKIRDASIPVSKIRDLPTTNIRMDNVQGNLPASRIDGNHDATFNRTVNFTGDTWFNGARNAPQGQKTHFPLNGKNYIRGDTDFDFGTVNFNNSVNLPISKTQGNLPMSRVEGNLPMSRVEGNLPMSRVEGNLPMSRVQGNLPMSRVEGNLEASRIDGNHVATFNRQVNFNGDTWFNGARNAPKEHKTHFPFNGVNYIRGDTDFDFGRVLFNNTTVFKGGNNAGDWQTHFPFADGKNYVRGDTDFDRGTVNFNNTVNLKGGNKIGFPNGWEIDVSDGHMRFRRNGEQLFVIHDQNIFGGSVWSRGQDYLVGIKPQYEFKDVAGQYCLDSGKNKSGCDWNNSYRVFKISPKW